MGNINVHVNVNRLVDIDGRPQVPSIDPAQRIHVPADGVTHAVDRGPGREIAHGGSLPREYGSVSREWKSADGWSWVKFTAFFEDKYRPSPVITFKAEFEARAKFWGNWIKETGHTKWINVKGSVRGNGNRRAIDIPRSVEANRYTWYDTIWLDEAWGNEIAMDLSVKKTGGYWASDGPRSSEVNGRMTVLLCL